MEQQEDFSKYNGEGTTLRKAQLRMVDILVEVDKICRRHNITYWLEAGTLLGAVRHEGFVPWDDDVDITLHRKDVKKLKKVLSDELPSFLVLQDSVTDFNFPHLFFRVRDKLSIYDANLPYKTNNEGLFIDIIPVEDVRSFKLKKFIDYVYGHSHRSIHNMSKSISDTLLSLVCYIPSLVLVKILRLFHLIVPSDKLGHIYGWISNDLVDKSDVYPVKEINFEGHSFFAPNNVANYLTRLYGNYMQLPPEKERVVRAVRIEFFGK